LLIQLMCVSGSSLEWFIRPRFSNWLIISFRLLYLSISMSRAVQTINFMRL
jgi:hypothetical protein